MEFIKKQQERYDTEAALHKSEYQSLSVQKLRDDFIRKPLFLEELKNKKVLDAMCASGVETSFLLSKGAEVVGLDISPNNAKEFEKLWQRQCVISSIHKTPFESNTFDAVYICGGLHHILPLLEETLCEVSRILKPGGYFYFVEPNKDTWLDLIRRIWYRVSPKFEREESAISYNKTLYPMLVKYKFSERRHFLGGNIAYVLIGQSVHFGFLRPFLRIIHKPLNVIESILNRVPFAPKLFFCSMWQKPEIS